jgi:hypothetical protein
MGFTAILSGDKAPFITDEQIRDAWASYYPKRHSEAESALICRLLCEVVVQRAQASTIIGTEDNQITHLGFTIGIPKSEFEEVRDDLSEL